MSDEPKSEFDRRLAELEEIIEEMEATEPSPAFPGLPRRPGLLATYLNRFKTLH
jgi:hypothetical protein